MCDCKRITYIRLLERVKCLTSCEGSCIKTQETAAAFAIAFLFAPLASGSPRKPYRGRVPFTQLCSEVLNFLVYLLRDLL